MYGYVYLTYLPQTDKFYIGQHQASQFDETYYGSGVSFVKDFKNTPKCDAKRIVIQECMTAEELNKAEEYWIDIYDAVNSSEFYNVSKGSTGLPYNRGLKFMYNQTTDDVIMVPECLIPNFEAEGYRRGNRPRNSLQLQHMSDAKKKLTVMTDDNVVIYVKEEDIPVLTLVLDEQTGKAGYITRIEAFIDLIKRKQMKKLKNIKEEGLVNV